MNGMRAGRLPGNVQECHAEAERRACLRMEGSMARMLKAAKKRRDMLEVRRDIHAVNSSDYLIAAHEFMILLHWEGWIRRNCDYRRAQVDDMQGTSDKRGAM